MVVLKKLIFCTCYNVVNSHIRMYWIYLALFVLIVLIPKIINGDRFFVEDDQESLLIFLCRRNPGFSSISGRKIN